MTQILTDIFLVALLVGTSVPGIVLAIRALPPIDRRVLAGQKPWACDVCMCFWTTGAVAWLCAGVFENAHLLFACGPAYTGALMLLAKLNEPPVHMPPGLADMLEPPEKK